MIWPHKQVVTAFSCALELLFLLGKGARIFGLPLTGPKVDIFSIAAGFCIVLADMLEWQQSNFHGPIPEPRGTMGYHSLLSPRRKLFLNLWLILRKH